MRRSKFSPKDRETAIASAKAMGLSVLSVNLLHSSRGPVIMEVNSSPEREGIEKATDIDVADKIIEFIEKNAKPGRTKTRGK